MAAPRSPRADDQAAVPQVRQQIGKLRLDVGVAALREGLMEYLRRVFQPGRFRQQPPQRGAGFVELEDRLAFRLGQEQRIPHPPAGDRLFRSVLHPVLPHDTGANVLLRFFRRVNRL